MPDAKRSHKLSAKDKLNLCALIAIGYNSQVCSDMFLERFGVKVSRQNVEENYIQVKKWQKIIKRMRREAERKVLSHPLAKKVGKLDIIKDAVSEAMTWRLDKIHYDKSGRELSRIMKRNIGVIPALIREARAEIEGDSPLLKQETHYHFTSIKGAIEYANGIGKAGARQEGNLAGARNLA